MSGWRCSRDGRLQCCTLLLCMHLVGLQAQPSQQQASTQTAPVPYSNPHMCVISAPHRSYGFVRFASAEEAAAAVAALDGLPVLGNRLQVKPADHDAGARAGLPGGGRAGGQPTRVQWLGQPGSCG